MLTTDIIRAKRDRQKLSRDAIRHFMDGFVQDAIPDYQAAALLMAIFLHGMDEDELAQWTDAMVHSGTVLDWSHLPAPRVDKHSSGGVGDKISIPLAPLVASCGLYVPMMAGRGLGHTGGTLDKLEAIAGYNTQLSLPAFREVVGTVGCAIVGQTEELVPADRRIYALRDATSTVESQPLIASSIMSKKIAEGIDALVLDVKTGTGAFLSDPADARRMADMMLTIGTAAGKDVRVLITNMWQPLGQAIGNANEIRESIDVLRGEGPSDVVELTLELGSSMLQAGGVARDDADARAQLLAKLRNGDALATFRRMVEAQGGDPRLVDAPERLPRAPNVHHLVADADAYMQDMDCRELGMAALVLGGGRARKEDTIDHAVGLELLVKPGQRVEKGQPWCEVHWRDASKRDAALTRIAQGVRFGEQKPTERPLVLERLRNRPDVR